MQTEQERLVEILRVAYSESRSGLMGIAQHLLAHGVTVPEPEPPAALIEEAFALVKEAYYTDDNNYPSPTSARAGLVALYRAGLLRAREDGR